MGMQQFVSDLIREGKGGTEVTVTTMLIFIVISLCMCCAQPPPPSGGPDGLMDRFCGGDIFEYCPGVRGPQEIMECLESHKAGTLIFFNNNFCH